MTELFVEKNVSRPYRQRGASVIKALVLIPVALILLLVLVFAFYEGRKAYWDYRVREMCERDGGVTVYENVVIDFEQFKAWGGIGGALGIPHESTKRLDIPFYRRTRDDVLHDRNPRVMRLETEFIRRRDEKLLGKAVYYYRRGGDFPSWAHESSFGCDKPDVPIEKIIFVIKERSK